jgi:hypothetical protein
VGYLGIDFFAETVTQIRKLEEEGLGDEEYVLEVKYYKSQALNCHF